MKAETSTNLFGETIKKARLDKKLSLRELASCVFNEKTGQCVSAGYLCDIEKGFRKPSPQLYSQISKKLDLPESLYVEIDPSAAAKYLRELSSINTSYNSVIFNFLKWVKENQISPKKLQEIIENIQQKP